MNKEMIERIALEVAQDIVFQGFEIDEVMASALTKYASALLSRIDAERWKDAKAFLIEGPYQDVTQRQEVADMARSLGYIVSPLFLCPTIPEGMALVKVAKLKALKDSISGDCYMGERWEVRTIDSMLAAAQGERNA